MEGVDRSDDADESNEGGSDVGVMHGGGGGGGSALPEVGLGTSCSPTS
jgi:hypothetical protein